MNIDKIMSTTISLASVAAAALLIYGSVIYQPASMAALWAVNPILDAGLVLVALLSTAHSMRSDMLGTPLFALAVVAGSAGIMLSSPAISLVAGVLAGGMGLAGLYRACRPSLVELFARATDHVACPLPRGALRPGGDAVGVRAEFTNDTVEVQSADDADDADVSLIVR